MPISSKSTITEALTTALQHHQAGRLQAAEQIYRRVLQADPNQPDALHLLGVLAHQAGRYEPAIGYIDQAIAAGGDMPAFHRNRARAQQALGRLDEAILGFRRAVELQPDFAHALDDLGLALLSQGEIEGAISCFQRAVEIDPGFAGACNNLGNAFSRQGKIDEAIGWFRRAIALEPGFFEAQNNLGNALNEKGRREEAVASLRQAVALSPEYAGSLYNLGNALLAHASLDEAVACYRRALQLAPDFIQAHNNLGLALFEQGKLDESIDSYHRALALDPSHREAHSNLALPLLLLGRCQEGWSEYEWRLALAPPRELSSPRWNGDAVEGLTLLLYCEQGLGDSLHFARFLDLIRERSKARRVILECQPLLHRLLLQSLDPGIDVVAATAGDPNQPTHDLHLPLLSAPHVLGVTKPPTLPRPYLTADPAARACWRERLGQRGSLRVGLAWQGNAAQSRDRLRSLPPEAFLPLLEIDGVSFYSLQIHPGGANIAAPIPPGLIDLTSQIGDFADTAAFVAELDLVIAVDTAVVHLAGALGRPVWNLLMRVPHWPWGMHGRETPWYPTMRLFRQEIPLEWEPVIRQVAEELRALEAGRRAG